MFLMSFTISAQEMYQNPLITSFGGFGIGDPATFRWMGKYYLIASAGPIDVGLNIYQSEDMVNWTHMGVCMTDFLSDPAGHDAWAPEVIYYEGSFYLYYAHPDQNTRVAKFELPLNEKAKYPIGPFETISRNLLPTAVNDIDASVFRDNDGELYLYYSSHSGINYQKLLSPVKDDQEREYNLSSCYVSTSNGSTWTEGPTMNYVNGTYYMTYCGNDLMRPDYQIHAGKGNSPREIYAQNNNPIIMNTTGEWTGTGHNHWVLGPDLKTYYTTYHVKYGDFITEDGTEGKGLHRRLMLDKIEFDANDNLISNGPTFTPQPVPELPDWSDGFDRSNIGSNWTSSSFDGVTNHGLWGNLLLWQNSLEQGSPNWFAKTISNEVTGSDFVIEFNMKIMGVGSAGVNSWPKAGVFVCQNTKGGDDNHEILYIALNPGTHQDNISRIETCIATSDDSWPVWQGDAVVLKAKEDDGTIINSDLKKWHTIRVEKNGTTVKIFYDNMLKITKTGINLEGGHFGFITENSKADFGWVGFSNIN